MFLNLRQRKPTRQPSIDYARMGYYFVTICTKEKEEILGKISGESMVLNDRGCIVKECWLALPDHYCCCRLHEFVIMPNHMHGIIEIVGGADVGEGFNPLAGTDKSDPPKSADDLCCPTRTLKHEELHSARNNVGEGLQPSRSYSHPASLSEILRGFKTFSARAINQKYPDGLFQWQRSFHDRIIRDKGELAAIGRYIVENPRYWSDDEENLYVREFGI